ncbi:hypothetical protein K8B33_12010 [Alcanivorax sp. JB21]|uniref:hypothetical protein n=1 Tax=Alcanivorax limicola TaxID=2874102 RepID=UPI001CBBA18D|nr:hypothetical protein [Alcanivorax limicola]MBZ2189827.1 hypothetical protein [Alcanivorax limicola]
MRRRWAAGLLVLVSVALWANGLPLLLRGLLWLAVMTLLWRHMRSAPRASQLILWPDALSVTLDNGLLRQWEAPFAAAAWPGCLCLPGLTLYRDQMDAVTWRRLRMLVLARG